MAARILLGASPRPVAGDDLVRRIRALVVAVEPAGTPVTMEVQAQMDGADIADLQIDLTGTVPADPAAQDRSRLEPQGAVIAREPATVRRLRVVANPLRIAGADVTVDVDLADVPMQWVETDANETAVELGEASDDAPVRGSVRLGVPERQLSDAVRTVADALAAEQGVAISKLDLEVQAAGSRDLRVFADARVKKGFLSASVQGSATASVDDRMGLTLSGIRLESGNPLVAALLAVARGRIQGLEGQRIDLVSDLGPGLRVQDLRFDVGDEIALSARLG